MRDENEFFASSDLYLVSGKGFIRQNSEFRLVAQKRVIEKIFRQLIDFFPRNLPAVRVEKTGGVDSFRGLQSR